MGNDEDRFKDIEELLPRFCDGMTTLEESRLVEEWIMKDEKNLKIVNHIHALHLAVDTIKIMGNADLDLVLNKVKRRMHVPTVSWWRWTQRIAAVMSIPLLLGCLWLYFSRGVAPETIQMVEVKTNPGIITTLVLPDSTMVCLNSESVLRYPSRFESDVRKVELEGEAYFDVTSDKKKRFIVGVGDDSRIEVYGTNFNVEAYAGDDKISTTLIEGSIGFIYTDNEGRSRKVNLNPQQKLVYEPELDKTMVYATSGVTETAWKDGKIVFNNTPINEVLRMLGKRFNVEFVVNRNLKVDDYAFTGTFTTQRLDRIMEYFKVSSRIKWRYLDSGEMKDEKQKIEIY